MPKRRNPNGRPMSACERGMWIDTEGTILYPNKRTNIYAIRVYQKDIEPLLDYCAGATKQGVRCRIHPLTIKGRRYHMASITTAPNVAKEISLTRHCIRTPTKQRDIQGLINSLLRPRHVYSPKLQKTIPAKPRREILEARKALNI